MSDFTPTQPAVWSNVCAYDHFKTLMTTFEEHTEAINTKKASLEKNLADHPKWPVSQGPLRIDLGSALECFGDLTPQSTPGSGPWLFTLRANFAGEGGGAYPVPGVSSLFLTGDHAIQAHIFSAGGFLEKVC
jgi:hypothetical protein